MAGITCYNIDGTPLNHLTQWDKNIVLILKGAETSPEPQIHFSNKRSQKAIIVDPQINGDSIYVDVPNVLLEDGYPLTIRIYYTYDDGSSRTRYTKFINVQPKAMPDDYVIEDTNEPLTEVDYSLYKDMPFKIIDLPLTENLVGYKSDGSTFSIKGCSPITKCPKYLGWRIDGDSRMYLYIGDMVNGQFIRDEAYTICVTSSNNVNYLNPTHSRFIETDGTKYFYYQKAKDDMLDGTSSIKLIGADVFPDSEEILATTPNYINNDSKPQIEGKYYSVVLPAGCDYAVFVKDDGSYNSNTLNVSYQTADGGIHLSLGASFGTIPEDAGAALIKIPNGCPLENVTVYTNKDVKIRAQRTQAKRIAKDVTEFQFFSKKGIYWDDSERPMEEGRRFCGVPYSSRWINSHHVGYEISPTTLANALNDPYSVAYDGGITDDGVWEISGKSEIHKESQNPNIGGGPGYGLVCSSFMMLMSGNPYPQTNRGFTFDTNFEVAPIMDYNAGMVVTNEKVQHCVYVQDIYESGNAVIEASTPCMAKTIHTNTIENPSYMATKTKIDYLDSFRYSVVNRDTSGYTKNLLDFDNIYIPSGNVRPWRGYKAVYGPWDKSYSGSGIGVTIHNDVTTVRLFVPGETNPVTWEVAAGTKYLDISDAVTVSGTYFVDSGTGTVQEKFRFFDHDPVTLSFDANGTAVFSDDKVEYAYIRVTGYGGEFNNYIDTSNESQLGGPVVIAAGKRYPDIAADLSRIKIIYAAIISDDTLDGDGNQDCWGRYSVLIDGDVRSEYRQSSDMNGYFVVQDTAPEDTTVLWVDPSDDTEDVPCDIQITGAKVGQTVKISAVDENGVPTAWEAVEFPGEEEYELIETIVCDGTFGNISRNDLSLKRAKIFFNMKAGSTAISCGVEGYNDAGLVAYAWLGNMINTGERFANVLLVSDGRNAYTEYTSPSATIYGSGTVARTSYRQNADTPIKRIGMYASGSGNLIPAGSTIEIWGVRA